MFELLMALGLFGGVVWAIAHAIFLLMRNDSNVDVSRQTRDTIARFVEENYGSRFVSGDPLPEENLRRL